MALVSGLIKSKHLYSITFNNCKLQTARNLKYCCNIYLYSFLSSVTVRHFASDSAMLHQKQPVIMTRLIMCKTLLPNNAHVLMDAHRPIWLTTVDVLLVFYLAGRSK